MGLLDKFAGLGNLDETQTQGLLAAASQMLQQSGPSRTPQGFGQIVGGGMEAYQGATMAAKRRKMQEEQAALEAKMYGLKIRDSESDFANQEAARNEQTRLQDFYRNRAPAGQGAAMGAPTAPGAQAEAGQMPQAPGQSSSLYEQLMGEATQLQAAGFIGEAQAKMKDAISVRPKFSLTPQRMVGADGKAGNYQVSDDGASPRNTGLGVAPDMVEVALGNRKQFIDKNAIPNGQSYAMGQTPDSVASTASAAAGRRQADRHHDDRENRAQNRFLQGTKPMTQLQETKYRTQIAKDYTSANTMLNNMDEVAKSAKAVKDAPGLGGATGLNAYLPSYPDGKASQAEVKLQNLEGKITSLGKAAAAMSGAVGPMAVQEWKIVRDMVAAIDPKKGKESLKEQIALVEETAAGAADRIRDGYSKHYGADFERYPQFENLAPAKSPDAPTKFAVTAPNGKEYNFPDAKSLANFKLKAGIK